MTSPVKIVATAGPATKGEDVIKKLITNGVNVFRFNFKHNEKKWHADMIKLVRKISGEMNVNVGILLDLPGPRIRFDMRESELVVKKGDLILLGSDGVGLSHPKIISMIDDGQRVIADDGAFVFKAEKTNGKTYLRSESSGILKNNKSVNVPDIDIDFPPIDERDLEGLKLAKEFGADFIALSSVRSEDDVKFLRNEMKKLQLNAGVVSKIETKKAIENIDGIIKASDAIMVARGDLGVEIPIEQVPYYQKVVVKKCVEMGVPVIIATQMLHSMVDNPFPTRAEISDVANAAYEIADAVMLSAETAFGKYPVETVTTMKNTVEFNAKKNSHDTRLEYDFQAKDQASMICDAAYNLYLQSQNGDDKIEGFIVFTLTGKTARLISRYRPTAPIYAFSTDQDVANRLSINYGVIPFAVKRDMSKAEDVLKADIFGAINYLSSRNLVKKGNRMIILHGDLWSVADGTSTIKVVRCV